MCESVKKKVDIEKNLIDIPFVLGPLMLDEYVEWRKKNMNVGLK